MKKLERVKRQVVKYRDLDGRGGDEEREREKEQKKRRGSGGEAFRKLPCAAVNPTTTTTTTMPVFSCISNCTCYVHDLSNYAVFYSLLQQFSRNCEFMPRLARCRLAAIGLFVILFFRFLFLLGLPRINLDSDLYAYPGSAPFNASIAE